MEQGTLEDLFIDKSRVRRFSVGSNEDGGVAMHILHVYIELHRLIQIRSLLAPKQN